MERIFMSTVTKAYEELIDFIAAGTKPGDVVAYEPSQATKERVADLIHREKTNALTPEEESELDHYMQLEHIMRLAKARARRYVAHE
jgi:hypothetical protein